MACTFCATGTMGLKGDLSAGEILEQVLHASRVAPIRNVVFMGERDAGRLCAMRLAPMCPCGFLVCVAYLFPKALGIGMYE